MANIINWLATNDTLLIRIGFTAVLVLVGVYVYRLSFRQRTQAAVKKATTKEAVAESKKEESADSVEVKTTEVVATSAPAVASTTVSADVGATQAAEMLRLKDEIQKLTTDLTETQAQNEELKKGFSADAAIASSSEKERINETGGDELTTELQNKIQQLETRLSEYEIIAEDIAEMSQLRQENEKLRKQTGAAEPDLSAASSVEAETEVQPEPEIQSEELQPEPTLIADADINDLPESEMSETDLLRAELEALADQMDAGTSVTQADPSGESESSQKSELNLVSEKPVTQTEQELIGQFEHDINNKKDS